MNISYEDEISIMEQQVPGTTVTVQQSEHPKMAGANSLFNSYLNGVRNWMAAHPNSIPGDYGFDDEVTQMYRRWIDDVFSGKYNYSEYDIDKLEELLNSVYIGGRSSESFSKRFVILQKWLKQHNNERPSRDGLSKREKHLAKWIYDTLCEPSRYAYSYFEKESLRKTVQNANNPEGARIFTERLEILKKWQIDSNRLTPHDSAFTSSRECRLAHWVRRVLRNENPYYYTDEQRRILKETLETRQNNEASA